MVTPCSSSGEPRATAVAKSNYNTKIELRIHYVMNMNRIEINDCLKTLAGHAQAADDNLALADRFLDGEHDSRWRLGLEYRRSRWRRPASIMWRC